MKTNRAQKGQALILIVFAVIGLIALTGLAVDGSVTYSNRQSAQNAADTAALTGALDLANSKSSNAVSDAQGAASTSGFTTGTAATVTVNTPPVASAACNGTLPTFSEATSQYVQVVIKTNVNTSFSSIVGVKQTHNCVNAIALGKSGSSGSMFNGAAIVATDPNSDTCMNFNGGSQVTTTGGGIFDNCKGGSAFQFNSGAVLHMPTSGQIVGGTIINGGTITPGVTTNAVAVQMPAPAWSLIPAIPNAPTCSGTNHGDMSTSGTYPPGIYGNVNANVTLTHGVYCISGVNSGNISQAAGDTGAVQIVSNGSYQSNGTLTFSDLEIYTSGNFQPNSGGKLDANIFRFYNSGSGAFTINSGNEFVSNDCYIYLKSGALTLNSGGTVNVKAPTTGPYANLLVYMPWDTNTNTVILDSGSGFNMTGTVLAPHANITLNSAAGATALNSQIIGYTYIFNSGSTFSVNYNAGQNYGTPMSAYVELVK